MLGLNKSNGEIKRRQKRVAIKITSSTVRFNINNSKMVSGIDMCNFLNCAHQIKTV